MKIFNKPFKAIKPILVLLFTVAAQLGFAQYDVEVKTSTTVFVTGGTTVSFKGNNWVSASDIQGTGPIIFNSSAAQNVNMKNNSLSGITVNNSNNVNNNWNNPNQNVPIHQNYSNEYNNQYNNYSQNNTNNNNTGNTGMNNSNINQNYNQGSNYNFDYGNNNTGNMSNSNSNMNNPINNNSSQVNNNKTNEYSLLDDNGGIDQKYNFLEKYKY